MATIETLIPDDEGNHLVVVLYFYDDIDKTATFQIPQEFSDLDIADININKLDLEKPLGLRAFFRMCRWLIAQFEMFPDSVFSFICSTDELETKRKDFRPELYRWNLFECLYSRFIPRLSALGVKSKDITVGPSGFQTYAKVFYRQKHAAIIHLVSEHLENKYLE